MPYTLVSPLYVEKNLKGDKWYLNLNKYRNTHFQTSNNVKKKYKEHMAAQIKELPILHKISVSFHIYAPNKRLFDIGNIASIHEKFFLDSLVELGRLKDDTYEYVPETHTYFKGIDKTNPRVEIIIKEIV